MNENCYDVAVIGGGLHGLSAALQLARAGKKVVILESSWSGRHASGATAAGVRTLNRDLGELDLSLEAMDLWHNISNVVGNDCGFQSHGQICVAENEASFHKLAAKTEKLQSLGYSHEKVIGVDELRYLVPLISRHCVGAIIAPADGAADPHKTLIAFRNSALLAGATLEENSVVTDIDKLGDDWCLTINGLKKQTQLGSLNKIENQKNSNSKKIISQWIVNAAGAWGSKIAAMVGDVIPLDTKASMMMVSERIAHVIDPVVSVAGRALSFKQSDQGTLVIGGGLQGIPDLEHEEATVRLGILAKGALATKEIFPFTENLRIVRIWAGLEAKTSDLLPVIGFSENALGVIHAYGFSGHGFQLVPVVGMVISDLIINGATKRPIEALQANRLMNS